MRKHFQSAPNTFNFINYTGLTGLFAFSLLNLAALVEYIKYSLGISNHFIALLPAIKLLLNIDLLFIVALILIYNTIEKFLDLKLLFTIALLIGIVGTSYVLVKHKPIVLISALGLYGLGISLYASIAGFGILNPKNDLSPKAKYDKL